VPVSSSAELLMARTDKEHGTRRPRFDGGASAPRSLPAIIGTNLKRLRTRQGHSLERLAKLAGVSRAMLSQIETGKSVPTISLLLKVAEALGVSLATLVSKPASQQTKVLGRDTSPLLSSNGGRFTARALFVPSEADARVEFYECRLAAKHREAFEPQVGGTRESVVVVKGRVELTVGVDQPLLLSEGDAALFQADVERIFRNPEGNEALLYRVVTYNGKGG
jgi:transcriptional regulator with XRE-family HTH domain